MKLPFPTDILKKIRPPQIALPFKKGPRKSRSRLFCGLDIGNHAVKCVELRWDGKFEMTAASVAAIKKERGREGVVLAIKEAMRDAGGTVRRVRSALGGKSVIARYVLFPKMALDELRSHIEVEIDKYIPFNLKDVVMDCQILEEKKEEDKIYALIVAAKKEAVTSHLAILKEAGLEPELLDVDTLAIVNAFENFLKSQASTKCHALLDVGSKMTNVSILRGTLPLFSRDIPIGGTDFTQAISEKLGLEMDAAEVLKCSGTKSQEELFSIIGVPLENLVGEIKLSFDYFENQYDRRVERIYLSGGSSRLTGFLSYLQKSFNIETVTWNPLEGIVVSSESLRSKIRNLKDTLAVAVGLALRGPV